MYGQIGAKYSILHAKQDQLYPIDLSDGLRLRCAPAGSGVPHEDGGAERHEGPDADHRAAGGPVFDIRSVRSRGSWFLGFSTPNTYEPASDVGHCNSFDGPSSRGPSVLLCTSNRAKVILLTSVMGRSRPPAPSTSRLVVRGCSAFASLDMAAAPFIFSCLSKGFKFPVGMCPPSTAILQHRGFALLGLPTDHVQRVRRNFLLGQRGHGRAGHAVQRI
jgi:hypothetical protein